MKWFKHFSDAHDDQKIIEIKEKYGWAGIGRWWTILELIASQMNETDRCELKCRLGWWTRKLGFRSNKHCTEYLQFLEKIGLIEFKIIDRSLSGRRPVADRSLTGRRPVADRSLTEGLIKCPKLLKLRARKNAIECKNSRQNKNKNKNKNIDNSIYISKESNIINNTKYRVSKDNINNININTVWRQYLNLISFFGKNPNQYKLTQKRRVKIKARLKNYSVEQLCRALENVKLDPWGDRVNYLGLETLFKSDEAVERWLNFSQNNAIDEALKNVEEEDLFAGAEII